MSVLAKNRLILASAGSGKTFQLANRLIGLVAHGVAPEKIVALTFTRKAAGEFGDSVLTKLAQAASDPAAAEKLRRDLALPNVDFHEVLERVVQALPQLTLGTMDSFFSRVIRGFQYELGVTGGKFDLLQGPRAEAAVDELLSSMLSETLDRADGEEFFHAFRRAVIGKESQGVLKDLRQFVQNWHGRYRTQQATEWGPPSLAACDRTEWEKQKNSRIAQVSRGLDGIDYTDKRQRAALEKCLRQLAEHTIGSGSLGGSGVLFGSIVRAVSQSTGSLIVSQYKQFTISGPAADALRTLMNLAANCELAAALSRTRAIREVIAAYDRLCEKTLRQRGLLGFDDVKVLMAQWATSEDARLSREAVDFRLGARYDHWLLDEFQDTSEMDWLGLLPLVDEAAGDGEGTTFIVGDKKQAIYAWRGGEVALFDEVISRYSGRLAVESLTESWRSCPEVLSLVNRVCGDQKTISQLFGDVFEKWQWQDHQSAEFLRSAAKCGEARVEWVEGKWEERLARCGEILTELEVGKRVMSCGVLVRNNKQVREVADFLRAQGFDVIEEGQREPTKDHPVGVLIHHLLKWLADPNDAFAWQVIQMSPLAAELTTAHGATWAEQWESLLDIAGQRGFAAMVEQVLERCRVSWSEFGKRRASDLISTLTEWQAQGGTTAREAAAWLGRLKISQSPGLAAVQVMTIHKSKGLGFDLVILPDIPNDGVPSASHFEVAEGPGWITDLPPKWARELLPEMAQAEVTWGTKQCYEACCMLYVALTRSKRGLYVLLELPNEKQAIDKPSLANWLATSIDAEKVLGICYQKGSPDWVQNLPLLEKSSAEPVRFSLADSLAKPMKVNPSKYKNPLPASVLGREFGNEVHAIFETLQWLDERMPIIPLTAAGDVVKAILKQPKLRSVFERKGRTIDLFNEQPIDAKISGQWLSGVIDRLHLHRDLTGEVNLVEVLDFKTDAVDRIQQLAVRYGDQMAAYRQALQLSFPAARVVCMLVSTHCCELLII